MERASRRAHRRDAHRGVLHLRSPRFQLDGVRMRRLTAIVGVLALSAAGAGCGTSAAVEAQCSRPSSAIFVLAAQSVPDATLIPCVKALPSGWSPGGSEIVDGRMTFWLNSDRAGVRALEVDLLPSCDVSDAVEVAPAPGEVGTR